MESVIVVSLHLKKLIMKNEYYIFSYLKKVKDYAIKIADERHGMHQFLTFWEMEL